MLEKKKKRLKRHRRIRARVRGTGKVPRLCVFRSNKHIYAQLIDDEKGKTLFSASDKEIKKTTPKTDKKKKEEKENRKTSLAFKTGMLIAEKSLKNKIEKVVFDRGGYKYHGNIKDLAEGAREGGLKF